MWGLPSTKKTHSLQNSKNLTVLHRTVHLQGVAHFDGIVWFDGRLEGEIYTKGTLVVGDHAIIRARITAGSLICSGKILGTIDATEKVELKKTAILIGDVRSPSFSMEPGAHFHGLCEMGAHEFAGMELVGQDREHVYVLPDHRREGCDLIGPAPGQSGKRE